MMDWFDHERWILLVKMNLIEELWSAVLDVSSYILRQRM
jgi:hypothetical protein